MSDSTDTSGENDIIWPNLVWMKTKTDEMIDGNYDQIDSIRKDAIEDQDATGEDVSTTSLFNMLRLNTEILTEILQYLVDMRLMFRATIGYTNKNIAYSAGTPIEPELDDEESEDKEDKE